MPRKPIDITKYDHIFRAPNIKRSPKAEIECIKNIKAFAKIDDKVTDIITIVEKRANRKLPEKEYLSQFITLQVIDRIYEVYNMYDASEFYGDEMVASIVRKIIGKGDKK